MLEQVLSVTPAQCMAAVEPEVDTDGVVWRADGNVLHYPTQVRRKALVLTFRLTSC